MKTARITYSGPESSDEAGLSTSTPGGVVFRANIPNPEFDPEDFYVIRGVKKWWDKPEKTVAYLTISPSSKREGKTHSVGQAWTDPDFRRQGVMKHLYEKAHKWAKSRGSRLCSGWVQSREMDRYWRQLEDRGQAEGYEDKWTKHNVGDRGWCRNAAQRIADRWLEG